MIFYVVYVEEKKLERWMLFRDPPFSKYKIMIIFFISVYPQKGQPYGPYGYAAYPGPAAYYGSQYGLPYSQY